MNRQYLIFCVFGIMLLFSVMCIVYKAVKIQKEKKAAAEIEAIRETIDAVMEMEQRHQETIHPDEQFYVAPHEEKESLSGDELFGGKEAKKEKEADSSDGDEFYVVSKTKDIASETTKGEKVVNECQENESAEGPQHDLHMTLEGAVEV